MFFDVSEQRFRKSEKLKQSIDLLLLLRSTGTLTPGFCMIDSDPTKDLNMTNNKTGTTSIVTPDQIIPAVDHGKFDLLRSGPSSGPHQM